MAHKSNPYIVISEESLFTCVPSLRDKSSRVDAHIEEYMHCVAHMKYSVRDVQIIQSLKDNNISPHIIKEYMYYLCCSYSYLVYVSGHPTSIKYQVYFCSN